MIPLLTVDKKHIDAAWKPKENADWVKNFCNVRFICKEIPVYQCDDNWIKLGVFVECKDTVDWKEFFEYGYCDTEGSLAKYLKKYKEDKENDYFVNIGLLEMDNEKYFKFGTYVNKDGEDTDLGYYAYINEHPDMKIDQDVKGNWITFCIYKLKK